MEFVQSLLDNVSYGLRQDDAIQHSLELNLEHSVPLIKPPLSATVPHADLARRKLTTLRKESSWAAYFRRLKEKSPEDYAAPASKQSDREKNGQPEDKQGGREAYGEPERKKQKKTHERAAFARRNPVDEECKGNQEILMKLQQEFAKRKSGGRGSGFGVTKMRATAKGARGPIDSEAKLEPTSNVSSEMSDAISTTARARVDEIAQVEAEIQALSISKAAQDRLYYDSTAQREANIVLEDVLLEGLYYLAEEVFNEEEEKSRNKELPPELLEIVEDALHEGPMDEVLIQKYNVDITRSNLQVLLPGVWLNDEVINFYYQMMNDRDEALVKAGVLSKRSHFFNSFFYTKVSENGYNFINVRRWTRKIDLFSMDKVFIPVNVGNMHWTMAVIFMTEKRIQYFDSMHGSGAACIKVLFRYLHDESEHKKKQAFDDEGWELVTCTPDTPVQNNGSDCGVFSCMFADYLALNKPLSFSQKDIPFHRHRMVLHVSRGFIPLDEEGL